MGGSMGKKKSKIIIVGLDNSGKSTMINKLKPKKVLVTNKTTSYFIRKIKLIIIYLYSMRKQK